MALSVSRTRAKRASRDPGAPFSTCRAAPGPRVFARTWSALARGTKNPNSKQPFPFPRAIFAPRFVPASPHPSEGDGAPSGATSVLFAPRSRGAAPRGAPSGDFALRAALFVRQSLVTASPSANSSHGLLMARGGVPKRPECMLARHTRGRRSRSHIRSHPDAPLVDRDAANIRPPWRVWIKKVEIIPKCARSLSYFGSARFGYQHSPGERGRMSARRPGVQDRNLCANNPGPRLSTPAQVRGLGRGTAAAKSENDLGLAAQLARSSWLSRATRSCGSLPLLMR